MRLFQNPWLNPFYTEDDEEPDDLAIADEQHQSITLATINGEHDLHVDEANLDMANEFFDTQVPTSALVEGETDYEGLKKAEAVTMVWSKFSLIVTYIGIYLIYSVASFQNQVSGTLQPYVYSSFDLHSLLPLSNFLAQIIGGVCRIPTSKLIDVWGRTQGFILMMFFMILGTIVLTFTKDIGSYCAGQVIYWIGNDGTQYVLDVIISDTSVLRNRALMLAFSTTPYIVMAFVGPMTGRAFVEFPGFNPWGYGMFAIILPALGVPLTWLFLDNERKARKAGLYTKVSSGRTRAQNILHYVIECDVGGLLILVTAFVLLLLPLSIVQFQYNGWGSPTVIVPLSCGVVLLFAAFPLYEAKVARKSFMPWRLLKERTLLGACLTTCGLFVSFYCWDAYFSSYCQVVYGMNVVDAGYMSNIYDISSAVAGIVAGLLVHFIGRYKVVGLFGVLIQIIGAALLTNFRAQKASIPAVIVAQVFIGFAGGILQLLNQFAAMAANQHRDVAVILALISLSSSIGGGIGNAVSSGIWSNSFEKALRERLPDESQDNFPQIAQQLTVQLSYPIGSPTRDAIIESYVIGQYMMTTVAASVLVLTFAGVWMWRNVRVDNKAQVKGTVV